MTTLTIAPLQVGIRHSSPLVSAGVHRVLGDEPDLVVHRDPPPEGLDVLITDHRAAILLLETRSRGAPRPPPLLVVTPTQRESDVRHALELGVQGYLLLGCTPQELLSAVRAVGRGVRWICAEAATRMADSMAQDVLTPREEQVLRLLVAGCSNKVIAQSLDLALGTVKTHVKAIFQKLNARSRTEAISISMQRGLAVSLDDPVGMPRAARDQVMDLE